MVKQIAKHIALHSLFMLVAMGAFPIGVFTLGVATIGDNPGALFGGVFLSLMVYLGLVGLEGLVHGGLISQLRQRQWKRILITGVIALGWVILSILAVDFAYRIGMSILSSPENLPRAMALFTFAVIAFELLFLGLFKLIQRGAASISARIWPVSTPVGN